MKVLKLVLGILCIVFSAFVLFQSCAAGLSNALNESNEVSGSAGVLVAILMLSGGIVMIATRNSSKKGGAIAGIIIFLLSFLIGKTNAGTYTDLNIWAYLCLIIAGINVISLFGNKQNKTEK